MVVWGGLKPIASRVFYDSLAVAGLIYATFSRVEATNQNAQTISKNSRKGMNVKPGSNPYNGWILLGSLALTVITAGNFTNRWTLTFPMIPLIGLQGLRRTPVCRKTTCFFYLIQILSVLCIVASIKLSILFPAVELPIIEGPFHVGSVDIHVPILTTTEGHNPTMLPVRVLYPTLETPSWPKYLNPRTAIEYCRESMRFGAPEPLRDFGWMLHTWRLTRSQSSPNATLVPGKQKFPVIMYSHGLGGNADIYGFQTMSLAAKGNVVVVMNHLDGSGPFVRTKCGKEVVFDYDTPKLDYQQQELVRRNQTDTRVDELVAATEAVIRMSLGEQSKGDTNELAEIGLSFQGRLETRHISAMGHSFGGVTSITAAKRYPHLYSALIIHEPAVGWMPDDGVQSFFAKGRISNLQFAHTILDRLQKESDASEDHKEADHADCADHGEATVHNIDALFLYSDEWREKGWGHSQLVEEMHKEGRLGSQDGIVHFSFIDGAHHNEFSDTCMLTPLWLARSVGVTGRRNPLDTAKEIHDRTLAFLNETRLRHGLQLPP